MPRIDRRPDSPELRNQAHSVRLVDASGRRDEVDHAIAVAGRLVLLDGRRGRILVRLEEFEVASAFGCGPAEHDGYAVDETGFGEFFEGVFVILYVDHC